MQQVLQISSQPAEVLFVLLKVTLFLGLIYIPIRIVYNIYFHPLSLYPGPTSCAATRFPYFRALLGGCLVKRVAEWHEAYGPVVRIAPDELSYTSAVAWKDIYGYCRNTMQNHKDTRFYSSPISDPADFDVSKKVDQSRYRSSLVQAFSGASLRQQEPIVKGYVDKLIGRLHQLTETETNPVDMVSWYSFATFDIIRDLAFGESFDCLENAQYHEWISMVFNKIRLGVYLNVIKRVPGGEWLLRFPLPKSFVPSQFRQQILTAEKVESHVSASNDKPTFLGHLLQQEDSSKKLTTPEILWNASAFILAGSETTATAICGITYYLLREPACLEKLVQEVRGSFNSEEEITFSSVSKLKYLLAVVNEGLRMYPPVPIGLPRIVPEGTVIDGKWVPRRTAVAVSQMSANRSPANFAHPDRFIPERFLDNPEFGSDDREAFQPFLMGPRNCLGQKLAYAEIRLILARVLWNFDMELDPSSTNWADQKTYFLWEKRPLKVRLSQPRGMSP